jgi:hypothetical protein
MEKLGEVATDHRAVQVRHGRGGLLIQRLVVTVGHSPDVCCAVLAHCAMQELQESRMAGIGNPAHKRETLGDKVG